MPTQDQTQPQVPTFNELAKSFDPMMDQQTYDGLRQQYFDNHVKPRIPDNFSVSATQDEFMKATERQPIIQHPTAAKLGLFGLEEARSGLEPLQGTSVGKKMLDIITSKSRTLQTQMRRDGISATLPAVAGDMAGSTLAFLGIEAATEGAGTNLGLAEVMKGAQMTAEQLALAARLSKGGVAFGLYEAGVAKNENRGFAFAKGAIQGTALGMASEGFNWAWQESLGKKFGVKAEEAEKDAKEALQANPTKAIDPEKDRGLATHIKSGQDRAKWEGKPLEIIPDMEKGVRPIINGFTKSGQPFEIKVEAFQEAKAVEQMLKHTKEGGQVTTITYHPDVPSAFNKFARMAEDMGSPVQERTVLAEVGKEKQVAASMMQKGVEAEPAGVGKVNVAVKKKSGVMELSEIQGLLAKHTLEDGSYFSKGEILENAKRLQSLQDPSIPLAAKEVAANQLAGLGLDRMIPTRWRRTPAEALAWTKDQLKKDITEPDPIPDVQAVMQEEIQGKSKNLSPAGLMEATTKDGQLQSGFHVEETPELTAGERNLQRAWPHFEKGLSVQETADELGITFKQAKSARNKYEFRKNNPAYGEGGRRLSALRIPASEQGLLGVDKSGLRVIEKDDRVLIKALGSQVDEVSGGTRAFVDTNKHFHDTLQDLGVDPQEFGNHPFTPSGLPKPVQVVRADQDISTGYMEDLYHEGLHVHIYNTDPTNKMLMSMKYSTPTINALHEIADGIAEWPAYRQLPHITNMEEAYVHATTALYMGDEEALRQLADLDTSKEHVLGMVDEVSKNYLQRISTDVDVQGKRLFQEKLKDAIRRTGVERLTQLGRGAEEAGVDFGYDAETNRWVVRSDDGAYHFDTIHDVADHLRDLQGAAYSPSLSMGFEMRGLRHPLADINETPFRQKDFPMPEHSIDGKDDRFRGILAASSFLRPTMDWAATVDTKLNSIYKEKDAKVPFFDSVKNIDDAVRNGATWIESQHATAAKFLQGGADKIKTMFQFVKADPKFYPAMKTKFGVDQQFMDNVAQARTWLENYRNETGIQVFNYLQKELPQLEGFNYDLGFVYGRDIKDLDKMGFFHKAITEGSLNPRDQHLGRFMQFLIREGYEKKFLQPHISKLQSIVNATDKEGKSILGTLKFPTQNYINYVRGIPDATQMVMTKTVGDFQKILGETFKKINTHLPAKYKLPEEFNYPGSIVNKLMSLSYVAGIGLRPIIPVRDALQVLTNTLPVLGPTKFLAGAAKLTAKGWAEAEAAGATLGRHQIGELYGDIFQEIGPHSGGALDKGMEIANKLMSPSRWGHNAGRVIAFHGEYDAAVKAVKAYNKGKSAYTVKQLFEDTSMWFFPKPLQTRIMKQILSGTPAEEVAKTIALETVDATLWPYRRGAQPLALRTGLGRIFGQYGMWPLNYAEFLKKAASKYVDHPKMAMRMTGLWAATNYAGSKALGGLGGDVGKWFFISPSGYNGSPHMQLALDIIKAPEESQDGREARKRILEYPINFIPASIEAKAVLKAMEDGGPMFENGMPTPDLLRVLGMKPKVKGQDEMFGKMSIKDRIEYEAGFKERR